MARPLGRRLLARPLGWRLLAIPPPTGPVDPSLVDRWLDAGAGRHGLALLVRELDPAERGAPGQPGGRLAALVAACQRRGVALILSATADEALTLVAAPDDPRALGGVHGIQVRGDPASAELEAIGAARPAWILGRSCHGPPQGGHHRVDYTCLAPIFAPTTAQAGVDKAPIGPERLDAWAREADARMIALGGITPSTAPRCLAAGAHGLAGIGLFFGAPARVEQDVADLSAILDVWTLSQP